MHFQALLVASLGALVLSSPLQERESYAWISAFDNKDMNCQDPPVVNQPYVKLKKENKCYQFAPGTNNIGWSWGAGMDMTVTRIKLFSDADCTRGLLHADMSADSNKHGYCLTTKQWQSDYPLWKPSNPPILSVMASSEQWVSWVVLQQAMAMTIGRSYFSHATFTEHGPIRRSRYYIGSVYEESVLLSFASIICEYLLQHV